MSKKVHPTILIGYGDYGRRVMQRLLRSAAVRGTLLWDERPDVDDLLRRRLYGLALLHLGAEEADDDAELMADLYRQIERVSDTPDALADAINKTRKRLLDDSRKHPDVSVSKGLDVIVLAQHGRSEMVGNLQRLLEPAMHELHQSVSRDRIRQGQDFLNLIQILDFEDYWRASPEQARTREAFVKWLKNNEHAALESDPSFGRVYIFDSEITGGDYRSPEARIDEAVLFLEFLLFEGQREGDSRRFYQRESEGTAAAAAVGLRAVQLSFGLMARLAAATYARGWMEHLRDRNSSPRKRPLEELLVDFLPDRIESTLGLNDLTKIRDESLEKIEQRLTAIPPDDADWPERVRREWDHAVWELKDNLSESAGRRSRDIAEKRLAGLASRLREAVQSTLNTTEDPLTTGQLLNEIRGLEPLLEPKPTQRAADKPEADGAAPKPDTFPGLDELHREYQSFQRGQVQTSRLRNLWWPLLAAAFALAAAPIALDAWQEFYPPEGIGEMARPWLVMISLWLCAWLTGRYLFHPNIEKRARRADDFYRHPLRGRLSDCVRAATSSDELRAELQAHSVSLHDALKMRVLGDVSGALLRVKERLVKREAEMEWLSKQLHNFLEMNSVDPSRAEPRFYEKRTQPAALRNLERNADLREIFEQRVADEARFAERQSSLFKSWSDEYSDQFLDPLRFLDELSAVYRDPLHTSSNGDGYGQREQERSGEISSAVSGLARIPLSIHRAQADRLPPASKQCIFPDSWLRLSGVRSALSEEGFYDRLTLTESTERAYFVHARLGIPTDLMGRVE